MRICYPESYTYKTPAISWSFSHEEAYNSYKNIMIQHHPDFQLAKTGLTISTEFPFIGASPNLLLLCSCCGKGCVQTKYPFNQGGNYIFEAVEMIILLNKNK